MKHTFTYITGARIAIVVLAFVLGTSAHSFLSQFTTPESSPVNVPAKTDMAADMPVPETNRDPVFGDGLRLVSNEVQLKNELFRYEVKLTYPQVKGSAAFPVRKLNKHIERLVTQQYQWLLNPSQEDLRYYNLGPHPEAFNSLYLDYKVVLATDSFLSIYFEVFSYGIGAAHSVQYSLVVNYDFKSNRLVKLSDIFRPGSKYLEVISKFCTAQLSKTDDNGALWTKELAPVARNFESWNMTPNGLRFSFDACKVFGCAAGEQTVEMAFTALKNIQRKYGN